MFSPPKRTASAVGHFVPSRDIAQLLSGGVQRLFRAQRRALLQLQALLEQAPVHRCRLPAPRQRGIDVAVCATAENEGRDSGAREQADESECDAFHGVVDP